MGGMALASGHHIEIKSLVSYIRGKPANLKISCWLRIFSDHSSLSVSSSLKNETDACDHSSHSVSSSLKNEIDAYEHSSHSTSRSVINEIDLLKHSLPFGFKLA